MFTTFGLLIVAVTMARPIDGKGGTRMGASTAALVVERHEPALVSGVFRRLLAQTG
jgi:hypothetical protein